MKNKILSILLSSKDYVSGQALAEELGVSRQAVWKGVNALKESGYEIASTPNKGYKLVSPPDFLNAEAIKNELKTELIGREIIVLDSVDSTNDYLKELGNNGCREGVVVTTREQKKGKGRMGRVWQSKRDENLAFSFLLRPKMAPGGVAAITPLAGLAVCRALRETTGLDCRIKWPNDIIVGKKKIVGILTEMAAEFDAVEYIITGIGVNIDQAVFPEEIEYKATSILLETGRHYDKNRLLAKILTCLEKELLSNNLRLSQTALEEYSDLCATIGKGITFTRGSRKINGMAVGVAENGELKVMLSDGSICSVYSGEVTVQGIY